MKLLVIVSDLLICVSLGLQLTLGGAQTLNLEMCAPYKGFKPIFYEYKLNALRTDIKCL